MARATKKITPEATEETSSAPDDPALEPAAPDGPEAPAEPVSETVQDTEACAVPATSWLELVSASW